MRLLLLLCCLLLTACADLDVPANLARPVPPERLFAFQEAPAGPSQYLVINRDYSRDYPPLKFECLVDIYIDRQLAVQLLPTELASFQLPLGPRELSIDAGKCGRIDIVTELSSEATTRYRVAFDDQFRVLLLPVKMDNSFLCRIGGCNAPPNYRSTR